MEDSRTVSFSPSFSCYASVKLADAAVKIAREAQNCAVRDCAVKADGVGDFEFLAPDTASLLEDGFFFPIFTSGEHSHSDDVVQAKREEEDDVAAAQDTSTNLFIGDRNLQSPPSSSESDEPEEFPPASYYCLWSPLRSAAAGSSPGRGDRWKSKSTGSSSSASKGWRFRDLLLRRSRSDGGGSSVFSKGSDGAEKGKDKTASYYGAKRRKSYLPYRQDLIGVFAAVNRLRH